MPNTNLTPFERNFREWRLKYPTRSPKRWVASTDRREVANFICQQVNNIRRTQLKAADDIIVSQDRIASEMDRISQGVEEIADGLEGLRSAFDWGFSELVWQIEKQREVLQDILEILQKPLGTQAKELSKRAEKAYRHGWIDDALQDFLESEEKNRYDFTVHQNLGNIYLFHKEEPYKALESYRKAVKYAEPESSYHASYALLHVGLIKYLQENFLEARKATGKAVQFYSKLHQAHYEHARYCAKLGKYKEAVKHLRIAIGGDRYYALKASLDQDFKVMKAQIRSLINKLRKEAKTLAESRVNKTKRIVHKAKSEGLSTDSSAIKDIKPKFSRVSNLLEKGSLYDCQYAVQIANSVIKTARSGLIVALKGKLEDLHEEKENLHSFQLPVWIGFFLFWGGVILFIAGLANGNLTTILFGAGAVGLFGLAIWASDRSVRSELSNKKEIEKMIKELHEKLENQRKKLHP